MIIIPELSATIIRHERVQIIASIQHQLVIGDRAYNVPGFDSDTLRVISERSVCDASGNVVSVGKYHEQNQCHVIYYNGRMLARVRV